MSADRPLLSIVIAAFNVEKYVASAIDSALAQTYARVEVVVVNDGSTDQTGSIIESYGDRVIRVDQPNGGLPAARNAAIAQARGDLIGILDADDLWHPTRAQRLIDYLEAREDLGAVTSDAYIIDVDVTTSRTYYRDAYGRAFPPPVEQPRRIAFDNFVFIGAIVRASLLRAIGGFDPTVRVSSDYDLWLRAVLSGARIGIVDEPLAFYRVRPGSLTADAGAHWTAHLKVVERHISALRAAHLPIDARAAYDLARAAEARGERRVAARWYLDAARGQSTVEPWARVKLGAAAIRALVVPKAGKS